MHVVEPKGIDGGLWRDASQVLLMKHSEFTPAQTRKRGEKEERPVEESWQSDREAE